MGTLVVAVVGLLLALVSLIWQITSWLLQYMTRVRVQLALGRVGGSSPFNAVIVTAINRSAHPVRVVAVYLYTQDDSGARLTLVPWGPGQLPGVIQSRDASSGYFDVDKIREEGIDLALPLVGSVVLATDKEVRAEPQILRPHPGGG